MSCRSDLKSVLIDASEQPVERPKKEPSGKKKCFCFTQKVQIIADVETGKILSSDFCDGKTHDFRLFKESGFLFLLIPDIRESQKSTKTAELRSKGKRAAL